MATAKDIAQQMETSTVKRGTTVRELLDSPGYRSRIDDVLKEASPAFVSNVLSLVANDKFLATCEPNSIVSGAMVAATLNLSLVKSLGEACLVPYKGFAQFQTMHRGYIQLALRTNLYHKMRASRVYEGQLIEWDPISGNFAYDLSARKSDKIIGYVSYFKLLSGFESFLYMSDEELMAHGNRYSESLRRYHTAQEKGEYKNGGLWVDDPEAMKLKTVTKQNLSLWGPRSAMIQRGLRYDQAVITSIDADAEPTYPDNPQNALPQATAALPASAVENMGDGPGELK